MEDQDFRRIYRSIINGYHLSPETVKELLGKILTALSQIKKESE